MANKKKKPSLISRGTYRVLLFLVRTFTHKPTIEGWENIPEDGCILVGNHSHMYGPINGEVYMPKSTVTWCAYQMTELKKVPAYSFQDFWHMKPKWTYPFYKMLSYIIAPLSVALFGNARIIPVYHDNRLLRTFRETMSALEEHRQVIIYPEKLGEHNHILYNFQEHFVDVAQIYHKRTGKNLQFVPMYHCPALRKVVIGTPITYNAENPQAEEGARIRTYLYNEITAIAEALPLHRVVPYANVSKKLYPMSRVEVEK